MVSYLQFSILVCCYADEDQVGKACVLGNLGLQPIKEIVAVVATESVQKESSAEYSSSRLDGTAAPVPCENQAELLENDTRITLVNVRPGDGLKESEQLAPAGGPLEEGIMKGGILDGRNAQLTKAAADALQKPYHQAPADDEENLTIAISTEDSTTTRQKSVELENQEVQGPCKSLATAAEAEHKCDEIQSGKTSTEHLLEQQQVFPESKSATNNEGQEQKLKEEVNSLSEEAMTRTLVSQHGSREL